MKPPRTLARVFHAIVLLAMLATAAPSQAFFLRGGVASGTAPATGYVTQRAPTATDDSSKGWAVGRKWNYNGNVYLLTDATPNAAVWQLMTGVTIYPLDDRPGAAVAVGAAKLRSAYSGPAISIRRTSDSADQDFNFASTTLSYGTRLLFSASDIATFLASGAGTYNTWYDQSGNGYDFTNELATRLDYYAVTENEAPTVVFNGPQQNSRRLTSANVPITEVQAVTQFMVGRLFYGNNSGIVSEVVTPTANRKIPLQISPNVGIPNATYMGMTSPQLLQYDTIGGNNRRLKQNSVSRSFTTTLASSSGTGVALGNGVGNASMMGMDVQAYILYNEQLNAADLDKVEASLIKAFNLYPQINDTFAIHGDSLEQGNTLQSGTTADAVWTTQVQALITKPFRYFNLGRGGARVSGASGLDNEAATIYPRAVTAGAENIMILGGGTNDGSAGTVTVTEARDAILSMATKAKAAGFSKVYWKPVLPRTGSLAVSGATFETWRLDLNAQVTAAVGSSDLDGVIPMPDSVYLLANFAGKTFDNVHFTAASNLVIAQAIADYINARHTAANDNYLPRFAANDNWLMSDLRAGFGKRKEAA